MRTFVVKIALKTAEDLAKLLKKILFEGPELNRLILGMSSEYGLQMGMAFCCQ